jgi:thymidylate synthase (FAD)
MLPPERTWTESKWWGSRDPDKHEAPPRQYAPDVFHTETGTPYLTEAGVSLIGQTEFYFDSVRPFVTTLPNGDDPEQAGPADYMTDRPFGYGSEAEQLAKYAGQLCYLSFGPKRSKSADMQKYLQRILDSHHGSVLEHASWTFQLWGISRSVTHELVRHRAGFSYSQVSQRYVGPDMVRFVERPEFADDPILHELFVHYIDTVREDYATVITSLARREEGIAPRMTGLLSKTETRKAVQQAARAVLPNMTEAPIVVTANARAWRHFLTERGSIHAEPEIRALAYKVWVVLAAHSPFLFGDYEWDERMGLVTPYVKV